MNEHDAQTDLTPRQAREHLERAEQGTVLDDSSRVIHGNATALFGVVIGAYFALQTALDGVSPWESLLIVGYVVILLGLAVWQSRAARVVPRHSRRIGWGGLGASVVLMLSAILAANYRQAGRMGEGTSGGEPVWLLVVGAVLIAAPMVVAGALIRRGDR